MRVLVCIKRVPAPGARIVLTEDAQAIDTGLLGFVISPHEECAVEEAVRLVEHHGGATTVLTLGPDEAEEQLRAAMSIGIHAAALLANDGADWAPMPTARAIASTIRELETRDGPFDLILFGNESADSSGYQVGIRVACALDRPVVVGIKSIEIVDGTVTALRETATGNEVYQLPLPAVLGVKEGINLPRYPTLRGRLDAKRAYVERFEPAVTTSGQTKLRLITPPQLASRTVVLGDGPSAAPAVVDILEELGLV